MIKCFIKSTGAEMNKQAQLAWVKQEIKNIMDNSNKTRYKALVATPDILLKLEEAFLAVAVGKAQAYENAMAGSSLTSFNWINEDQESAKNILLLQQNLISLFDVAMLPN
jgi:hypothetical protein